MKNQNNYQRISYIQIKNKSIKISENYALKNYYRLKEDIEKSIDFNNGKVISYMKSKPNFERYFIKYKKYLFQYLAPEYNWAKKKNYSQKVKAFIRKIDKSLKPVDVPNYYYEQLVLHKKLFKFDHLISNFEFIKNQINNKLIEENKDHKDYAESKWLEEAIFYYLKQTEFTSYYRLYLFLERRDYLFGWLKK